MRSLALFALLLFVPPPASNVTAREHLVWNDPRGSELFLTGNMSIDPSAVTVIDGDTIRYQGQRWRLQGFDTPESEHAKCAPELAMGLAAKVWLQNQIGRAGIEILLIPSGRTDRYGRQLGTLTISEQDVGEIMIGEGLARKYEGGQREGWCDE